MYIIWTLEIGHCTLDAWSFPLYIYLSNDWNLHLIINARESQAMSLSGVLARPHAFRRKFPAWAAGRGTLDIGPCTMDAWSFALDISIAT